VGIREDAMGEQRRFGLWRREREGEATVCEVRSVLAFNSYSASP